MLSHSGLLDIQSLGPVRDMGSSRNIGTLDKALFMFILQRNISGNQLLAALEMLNKPVSFVLRSHCVLSGHP